MPCAAQIRADITRPEYWVECFEHQFKSDEYLTVIGANQALGEHLADPSAHLEPEAWSVPGACIAGRDCEDCDATGGQR